MIAREETCLYCGYDSVEEATPAVWDDQAWIGLAQMHASDCEWILTRAHQLAEGAEP